MARIRSAKPEFWTKAKWCALPRDVRFTYKGIWEVMCDDEGRFQADVRLVKSQVWPLDDDITTKKIEQWLKRIATVSVTLEDGRRFPAIVLYEVDGVRYGWLPTFNEHQRISHATKSKLPNPSREFLARLASGSGNSPESLRPERSGAERKGFEGRGLEAERSEPEPVSAEDLDPVVRHHDRAAPPAPRVVLPVDAERFVEQLYSLGSEKRKLDVRGQLYDAIDPLSRGARLRKGVHVKARSSEHLAECCREVLADPPRNIDAAIVILLEKLQDPPKGPSAAEKRVADERAQIEAEERYTQARSRAAKRWAHEHEEEYRALRLEIEKRPEYQALGTTAVTKQAIEVELSQRCAERAGFPSFEEWRSLNAPSRLSA